MRKVVLCVAASLFAICTYSVWAQQRSSRPKLPQLADFQTVDAWQNALDKYITTAVDAAIDERVLKDKQITMTMPSSERYRIVMRDGVRADTFLLDTQTGHIWSRVKITDVEGQPDIWRFEERVDDPVDFRNWLQSQPAKKN
jgi:hypothetical protein